METKGFFIIQEVFSQPENTLYSPLPCYMRYEKSTLYLEITGLKNGPLPIPVYLVVKIQVYLKFYSRNVFQLCIKSLI